MKIILLSAGSVSAFLSLKLKSVLESRGHEIRHYFTKNAQEIVKADCRNKMGTRQVNHLSIEEEILDWARTDGHPVEHIDAVNWADACVVCPADFNIIGKMATGIADDFVSTVLAAWLGSCKPLFIAEAMNTMMFRNPVHEANANALHCLTRTEFIYPTMKRLACGDFGIGALADIGTIANIVEGHRWIRPVQDEYLNMREHTGAFSEYLPRFDEPGAFGAKRKHDRHQGVDIYCREASPVYAVEDGEIVDSYQYTGEAVKCGWWNDTWCIKVRGKSGVVSYGELQMPSVLEKRGFYYKDIGTKVKAGDLIGYVGAVLPPQKLRTDIRNHSTSMLHMELRTECCHMDAWGVDADRDKRLLDPTPYLKLIK